MPLYNQTMKQRHRKQQKRYRTMVNPNGKTFFIFYSIAVLNVLVTAAAWYHFVQMQKSHTKAKFMMQPVSNADVKRHISQVRDIFNPIALYPSLGSLISNQRDKRVDNSRAYMNYEKPGVSSFGEIRKAVIRTILPTYHSHTIGVRNRSTRRYFSYESLVSLPTSCECEYQSSGTGTCYRFIDKSTNLCTRRRCRPKYVCVSGHRNTGVICIQRRSIGTIVSTGLHTCKRVYKAGFQYVPYTVRNPIDNRDSYSLKNTSGPQSCHCRPSNIEPRGKCYRIINARLGTCEKRLCERGFVCVNKYTGITCIRRRFVKVVPVDKSTCAEVIENGYQYAPY